MSNQLFKFFFFAFTTLLTACLSQNNSDSAAQTKPIIILFDNDVHCEVEKYPIAAFIRDSIVASGNAYTLLVSSGDFLQGGAYGAFGKGEHIVKLLNAANYDVLGLGNHEFDYKMPRFFELAKQIKAPIVNANFTDTLNNLFFEPYIIKEIGGKKLAFVGILTPDAMVAESYAFYDEFTRKKIYDLHMEDIVNYVQAAVDKAREKGQADYVIALTHLGENPKDGQWTSQEIIRKTSGIDVVLDGHSHSIYVQEFIQNKNQVKIPRAQTGTKFQNLGKLEIFPDGKIKTSLIPIDTSNTKSPTVKKTLDSIKNELAPIFNTKIANTNYTLSINDENGNRAIRNRETNLGDLVADAVLYATKAQISFVNAGGIRTGIAKGEITYKNIIDVLPHNDALCTLKATGKQILDLLEESSSAAPDESGGFLQVSGLKYTINTKIKNTSAIDTINFSLNIKSNRRVQDVMIADSNGHYSALDPLRTYLVGTSAYLAQESNENKVLRKNKINEIPPNDTDALIDFLIQKLNKNVPDTYSDIKGQGRITIK